MANKWDAVVIGSGIGGLTCGAFLAKAGLRVKVLEKHYQIGGYAHSFSRGQYRFESGIHSAPMESTGFVRLLLKTLGVDDKIETISHDTMYTSTIGNLHWNMPTRLEEITAWLCSEFPHERNNVNALFADMERLYSGVIGPLYNFEQKGNETNPGLLKKYQEHTYQTYIESFIQDEKLRQIFYSQWPFSGLTPERMSTVFFSLMYYVHAIEGSHYLKGGFETLAHALASVITDRGGEVCTRSTVQNLIVENGAVKRAVLESGEDIEADLFISNVSPYLLVNQLLEEPARNRLWQRRLQQLTCSGSAVGVYLGLDSDITSIFPQNILFWYEHDDFRKMYDRINNCSGDDIDHLIVLKTPNASEKQTLFLMTYANYGYTDNWTEMKERYAARMLDKAETLMPGLGSRVQCKIIASPKTFERYTGNTNGTLYGFANSSDRYSEAKMPMLSYIPNLYQTGHWCRGGGVWNVMESGFSTSQAILKKRS